MLSLCELPVDITTDQLLPRLHIKELATLATTCRHLQLLCNDDRLWRYRTTTDFSLNTSGLEPCQSWKQIYKKMVEHSVVYVWGENYDKRLGIHDDNQSLHKVVTPIKVPGLNGKGIAQIVAGGWSFHALDYQGRVWMWGLMQPRNPLARDDQEATPGIVHLPSNIRIIALASGRSHAIALDDSGKIWHWSNRWQPMLVKNIASVVQITACAHYSIALSSRGILYMINYPIINSTTSVYRIPISLRPDDRIIQIAAMDSVILVLTARGRLFRVSIPKSHIQELLGFPNVLNGSNRFSLIAHHHWFAIVDYTQSKIILGDRTHEQPLQQVHMDTLVNRITLGKNHMGVLTVDGTLLTGTFLQNASSTIPLLGHHYGSSDTACTYAPVDLDITMHVFAAGFGAEHSACLALPREIF
ncbi:RCC1/BLIP-II [Lichtheimia hyalospora FSU 10163]|nr:RCC1/BLIP-II [Lichtheimia hyalospora FSU 10163]